MMKKSILLLGLLATWCGCTNHSQQDETMETIQVLPAWENLSELKCSQLGKSIRYVPLETTDSSLIGNSYNLMLLDNHILVTTDKRALLFDKETGKYLRQIGHFGDDPEGYLENVCFANQQTHELCFPRHNKLIKYGLDGKYIGEMDFPSNGLSSSSYPLLLDNSAWVHLGQSFGGDGNFQLYYTSGNGVKTDSILVRDGESTALNPSEIMNISVFKGKGSMAGFGLMGCNGLIYINMKNDKTMLIPSFYPSLWSMDDQIRFREPYNDTIFNLKDNVLKPTMVFDMGERHLPKEKEGESVGTSQYLAVTYVIETPKVVFFQCAKDLFSKHEMYNGVYNKKDGSVQMNNLSEGFTDDLTGFLPFNPEASNKRGEIASTVQVIDIQEWKEEHGDTNIPDALKNLKDDDNPVCVIIQP